MSIHFGDLGGRKNSTDTAEVDTSLKEIPFLTKVIQTSSETIRAIKTEALGKSSAHRYESIGGLSKEIRSATDVINKTVGLLSLEEQCLERGIRKEEIQALADLHFGGNMEAAAAFYIKQNLENWEKLEASFGELSGISAIQTDKIARSLLGKSSSLVKDHASGLSFYGSGKKVFVINPRVFAEGTFKTAHKVMEYFTGLISVFLQAHEDPLTPIKPKKSELSFSDEEEMSEFLTQNNRDSFPTIDGAPKGFMEDIHWAWVDSRTALEGSKENLGELGLLATNSVESSLDEKKDLSGTFVVHEEVDAETSSSEISGSSFVVRDSIDSLDDPISKANFMAFLKSPDPFKTKKMDTPLTEEEKWKREIVFLNELKDVPHVARMHAVVDVDGHKFSGMVHDLYKEDLQKHILNQKKSMFLGETNWSEYKPRVCGYLADAAEALAGMHDKGLIHRDIKEANIMTNEDGGHVCDLGTMVRTNETSIIKEYAGTPIYSAPEMALGEATTSSDVWSFAIVVHTALIGPMDVNPVVSSLCDYMEDSRGKSKGPMAILNALKALADPSLKTEKSVAFRENFEKHIESYFEGEDPLNKLLKKAFSLDPSKRPTMREFTHLLRSMSSVGE